MDIQSTTHSLFASSSYALAQTQSSHAQAETHKTQQQSNEQIASSKESNKTQSDAQAGTTDHKALADGKAVKQAEQALDEAELKKVSELKRRDTEVRAHEAAHLAAAGKYATGGASFDYKRGPDGKSYAVGGEVGIDTSPVPNDPKATLRKAQQIQAAAHAPANPSAQDRQVAAQASAMASQARAEISQGVSENLSSALKPELEKNKANSTGPESESESESKKNATNETENQKASNEYQTVAAYTNDAEEPIIQILQQIA